MKIHVKTDFRLLWDFNYDFIIYTLFTYILSHIEA